MNFMEVLNDFIDEFDDSLIDVLELAELYAYDRDTMEDLMEYSLDDLQEMKAEQADLIR